MLFVSILIEVWNDGYTVKIKDVGLEYHIVTNICIVYDLIICRKHWNTIIWKKKWNGVPSWMILFNMWKSTS